MDLDLLDRTLRELDQPAYRARQVWNWTARGADGFGAMTDLPLRLRSALQERVPFSTLTVEHEARSSDGTIKALLRTHDGRPVEAVLMRYADGRLSLCLSSQSGCPLTCTFCATGQMRFARNLSTWEILDQVLHFRKLGSVDHAVFMGMGEPMMNIGAVLAACEEFYAAKKRKVFVEYVMLAGVNDSHAQAKQLAELLDRRVYKVNLIPFNPTGSDFTGSSPKAIAAFRSELERHGHGATVRLTRGRDIDAACGQLAARSVTANRSSGVQAGP